MVALAFSFRFVGLTTPGEMFGLAVIFGSVYGAFQGYARAFHGELIPRGEEARWYGFFDHGQEQFVSWSIGVWRYCGFDWEYQIWIFDLSCNVRGTDLILWRSTGSNRMYVNDYQYPQPSAFQGATLAVPLIHYQRLNHNRMT